MKGSLFVLTVCLSTSVVCLVDPAEGQFIGQTQESQVVDTSAAVLQEIMAVPAKQIPQSLLSKARGIAIVPNVVKGGFVIGFRHGRGVMLIRDQHGNWQPPNFISLTGGSVGWQAGVQSTDIILVFQTQQSVANLMNGKLTLGVDAAASAGPVGRNVAAATDVRLQAEILSYSRSRGLFAGAAFDGSVISVDYPAGVSYYQHTGVAAPGQPVTIPPSATRLMGLLAQYSGGPAAGEPSTQMTQGHVIPVENVARPDAESVRRQLAESCANLQQLLDPQWKAHLALPREVFVPDKLPRPEDLKNTVQRFDAIAKDPQYSALTRRTEFTTTYRLLREYAVLFAQNNPSTINLPPPPPSTRPGTAVPGR